MNRNAVKGKIFISGGLILALMFFHLVVIVDNCEKQVINSPAAISAFNG